MVAVRKVQNTLLRASFTCGLLLSLHLVVLVKGQSLIGFTNKVVEWQYTSDKEYPNPFRQVSLSATITNSLSTDRTIIQAFWGGGNTWTFRFSTIEPGEYRFQTNCNDQQNNGLHGKSGIISIKGYQGDNPIYNNGSLRVSDRGNYLEHLNGSPFFWLADSWWHGMTARLDFPDGFERLADDRKQKGFNVIQFAIAFPCDIAPFDPRGQNAAGDPWDETFESINPEYFDLTDTRVEMLLEKGFVPNIVGLWGYYIKYMGVRM